MFEIYKLGKIHKQELRLREIQASKYEEWKKKYFRFKNDNVLILTRSGKEIIRLSWYLFRKYEIENDKDFLDEQTKLHLEKEKLFRQVKPYLFQTYVNDLIIAGKRERFLYWLKDIKKTPKLHIKMFLQKHIVLELFGLVFILFLAILKLPK